MRELRPGFEPPGRKKLRELLDEEAERVHMLDLEELSSKTNIVMGIDGWTNLMGVPTYACSAHYTTSSGKREVVFVGAKEPGAQRHTGELVAEILRSSSSSWAPTTSLPSSATTGRTCLKGGG